MEEQKSPTGFLFAAIRGRLSACAGFFSPRRMLSLRSGLDPGLTHSQVKPRENAGLGWRAAASAAHTSSRSCLFQDFLRIGGWLTSQCHPHDSANNTPELPAFVGGSSCCWSRIAVRTSSVQRHPFYTHRIQRRLIFCIMASVDSQGGEPRRRWAREIPEKTTSKSASIRRWLRKELL